MYFSIKQGDILPHFKFLPTRGGVRVPYSEVADVLVTFTMVGHETGTTISRSMIVEPDGEDAFFRFLWQTGDTDVVDIYDAEMKIELTKETFPNDRLDPFVIIHILPNLT